MAGRSGGKAVAAAVGVGRTSPPVGVGGLGGPQGVAEGSRSWRGGGGWSSHPIPVEDVANLCRLFPSVLKLSAEKVSAARSEWEQLTVVTRSLGHGVPVDWLAKDVAARLGLSYEVEVFVLAEDHFALRFQVAEDRNRALTGGPWVVAGQLMAMEAWQPGFVPGSSPISTALVWIRMPKLPMEFWGKELLLQVAAVAGRPVAMDEHGGQRRRMGYARVKVEVDVLKPLVPGVRLEGLAEPFWQAFVYESLPEFCYGCGRIGHTLDRCQGGVVFPGGR